MWRTELKDCRILEIIHIDKNIDLVNSMNPDYYGWTFWDFENHRISESFNSSLYAKKQFEDKNINWRKMGTSYNPRSDNHSIESRLPSSDRRML